MVSVVTQRGMTLVEVMVATAILALVMVSVIVVASHTQRSTLQLAQKTQARWVVNNISAEIRAGLHGQITPTGGFQGRTEQGLTTWFWQAKAQALSDHVIELEISIHENESTPAVVSLKTAVWRPS